MQLKSDESSILRRGYICAIVGASFWGLSGTSGQMLLKGYGLDPVWLSAVRSILSGSIMVLMAIFLNRERLFALCKNSRAVIELLVFGILGLLGSQVTFFLSVKYSNAGTAAVLQSLNVVFLAIIGIIGNRRLPYIQESISILLALTGVLMISTNGQLSHLVISPPGLFWGVIAAVGSVLCVTFADRLVNRWGALASVSMGMFIGGVFLSVPVKPWTYNANLDMEGLFCLAFLVLVGTVGAFFLFLQGVAVIGPQKAALIGTLEPVTAALGTSLVLGTVFTKADLIGFACIIATVFIVTLGNEKKPEVSCK